MFKPGLLAGAALWAVCGVARAQSIILQSTTSTQNSGLFDYLLPVFEKASGIEVRVVAVGTGQALRNAAEGNGDAVMVHAKGAEDRFVADGFGVKRIPVMYNEFVIVGPPADPAIRLRPRARRPPSRGPAAADSRPTRSSSRPGR